MKDNTATICVIVAFLIMIVIGGLQMADAQMTRERGVDPSNSLSITCAQDAIKESAGALESP